MNRVDVQRELIDVADDIAFEVEDALVGITQKSVMVFIGGDFPCVQGDYAFEPSGPLAFAVDGKMLEEALAPVGLAFQEEEHERRFGEDGGAATKASLVGDAMGFAKGDHLVPDILLLGITAASQYWKVGAKVGQVASQKHIGVCAKQPFVLAGKMGRVRA